MAASVAALTVRDMRKAAGKAMVTGGVRLRPEDGGRSDRFEAEGNRA